MAAVSCSYSGSPIYTGWYDSSSRGYLEITSVSYETTTGEYSINWSMKLGDNGSGRYNFIAEAASIDGTVVNFTHPSSDYSTYWTYSQWSSGTTVASGTFKTTKTSVSLWVQAMFSYGWTEARWNSGTGCVSQTGTLNITAPSIGNPSVSISKSSSTTSATLTVSGSAGTNGGNVSFSTTCNGSTKTGSGALTWTGLSPHTDYSYSSVATNSAGKTASTSGTVTTSTPSAPTYTCSFSDITRTSAKLNISITSDPDNYWRVHYYTTSDTWIGCTSFATGNYSYTYSGLTPNTQYTVYTRVGGIDDKDVQTRVARTFTTSGNAPTISSVTASPSRTGCSLSSSVTYDTNASFKSTSIKYGTSTSYGSTSSSTSLTGLQPNTTYYYSMTVTDNWSRTSAAKTGSFKTTANAPTNVSGTVSNIEPTGATVTCSATPDTNVSISTYTLINEDGTTWKAAQSSNIFNLTLTPETTYKFKVRATDSASRTGDSSVITITTPSAKWLKLITTTGEVMVHKCYIIKSDGSKTEVKKEMRHII